jgi:hypothetical protein
MGGSAILIHGDIDARRLVRPPGFLARLLGRPGVPQALGAEFIELPGEDLKVLAGAFADYLRARMPVPTPSTRPVFDYLRDVGTKVDLRGEKRGSGYDWYVQLYFSGCAGMAEISAEVAAHWAMRWYADEGGRIEADILGPRGFTAATVELAADPAVFLPVGSGGYAHYPVEPERPDDRRGFSIDGAATEWDEAEARRVQAWLEAHGAALVRQAGCHCQLCAPGFDAGSIPGFKSD